MTLHLNFCLILQTIILSLRLKLLIVDVLQFFLFWNNCGDLMNKEGLV